MTGFNVYRVPTKLGRALVAWPIMLIASAVLFTLMAVAAVWEGAITAAFEWRKHWREMRDLYRGAADALFFRGRRQ